MVLATVLIIAMVIMKRNSYVVSRNFRQNTKLTIQQDMEGGGQGGTVTTSGPGYGATATTGGPGMGGTFSGAGPSGMGMIDPTAGGATTTTYGTVSGAGPGAGGTFSPTGPGMTGFDPTFGTGNLTTVVPPTTGMEGAIPAQGHHAVYPIIPPVGMARRRDSYQPNADFQNTIPVPWTDPNAQQQYFGTQSQPQTQYSLSPTPSARPWSAADSYTSGWTSPPLGGAAPLQSVANSSDAAGPAANPFISPEEKEAPPAYEVASTSSGSPPPQTQPLPAGAAAAALLLGDHGRQTPDRSEKRREAQQGSGKSRA